ncbi:MAG: hypothetical protein D6706_19645 [Chloroflexi bacterium]|nr:MAG: hypothetical protein D6706_19645 [Chloroflexota bacterium]
MVNDRSAVVDSWPVILIKGVNFMHEVSLSVHGRKRPFSFTMLLFLALILALVGLLIWMAVTQFGHIITGNRPQSAAELPQTTFTEATGVRIMLVAITAGGGMIDLRYQIADPDKAVIVHDEENPPTIIDERTGKVISRPWHDHAHDQDLHTAVTYYELILNPDGLIRPGQTVTIRIGNAELKHVPVQ